MSTKSKEREQARRRQEKWERHQAQLRARRQRAWTLVGVVASLLVIGGAVWLALAAAQDGTDAGASPTSGTERTLPPASAAEGREWTSTLTTSAGDITLSLDGAAAPQAVANFVALADSGVGAIVLYSLFEEEVHREELRDAAIVETHENVFGEAMTYFPTTARLGDAEPSAVSRYLKLIERAAATVNVPVIGSLNGSTEGGWTRLARSMQNAQSKGQPRET